jgi:hypothetical protein
MGTALCWQHTPKNVKKWGWRATIVTLLAVISLSADIDQLAPSLHQIGTPRPVVESTTTAAGHIKKTI